MGVNNFADKTDDEIKEVRGTRRAQEHLKNIQKKKKVIQNIQSQKAWIGE